jgi:hypothetical protein
MKELPNSDFRATRLILEANDFALGGDEEEPAPTDLIKPAVWTTLTSLPDDVAIRSTNHFGSMFEKGSSLTDGLASLTISVQEFCGGDKKRPMRDVLPVTLDELNSSVYCALTGYYRLAFSALRNVIEQTTFASTVELSGDISEFNAWQDGDDLKFSDVAAAARKISRIAELETILMDSIKDDLFRQRNGDDTGGLARRLYRRMSKSVHGSPGYSDGDIRNSNGPIFVEAALLNWWRGFLQAITYAIFLCRVTYPEIKELKYCEEPRTLEDLYANCLSQFEKEFDGFNIFKMSQSFLFKK